MFLDILLFLRQMELIRKEDFGHLFPSKVLVNSRKSGVNTGIRKKLISRCRYLFHQEENLWLSLLEITLLSCERMMITGNLVAILHVRNSGISSLAFTNVCLIMFFGVIAIAHSINEFVEYCIYLVKNYLLDLL
jgi:hypothetical protein